MHYIGLFIFVVAENLLPYAPVLTRRMMNSVCRNGKRGADMAEDTQNMWSTVISSEYRTMNHDDVSNRIEDKYTDKYI